MKTQIICCFPRILHNLHILLYPCPTELERGILESPCWVLLCIFPEIKSVCWWQITLSWLGSLVQPSGMSKTFKIFTNTVKGAAAKVVNSFKSSLKWFVKWEMRLNCHQNRCVEVICLMGRFKFLSCDQVTCFTVCVWWFRWQSLHYGYLGSMAEILYNNCSALKSFTIRHCCILFLGSFLCQNNIWVIYPYYVG